MSDQKGVPKHAERKVRILHVLEATLGGTLRYLNDIIKASDGNLYAYGLAYATERADPDLAEMLERAHLAGWQTFHLEMVRAVNPQIDFRSTIALRRTISEFSPDILHCHSSKAGAIGRIGRLVSKSYPKVVYSPHAIAANLGRHYLFIERALAPLTTRFSAVSESERFQLVSLNIGSENSVDVVHPTIDTSYFDVRQQQHARSELSVPVNAKVIVGVGRLVLQKNPHLFLEVVQRVSSFHPDLKAFWIGDGEMRAEIYTAIIARGLSGVVNLVGWQQDVRPYIAASDLLLSCSSYESFGYMVAEALAMERPVIASNVTGTRDIMSGPLGEWLYAPGDPELAASKVSALLKDQSTAARVGAIGREEMKRRFNREAMTEALDRVYKAALRS